MNPHQYQYDLENEDIPDAHSGTDSSSPYLEDEQDIDTLLECLEIIHSVVTVSPSQESLSSFGYHSVGGVERKCSFDLDSNASQAGDPTSGAEGDAVEGDGEGEEERRVGRSRTGARTGRGSCSRGEVGVDTLGRAAYSWSPPFTPTLDQPDPFFTPKSTHSD